MAISSSFGGSRNLLHHKKVTSSSPILKSRSIPITNGMKRTPSEVQLLEDEEVAEFRDYVMFSRIADRIARQQNETKDFRLRQQNDMCLAHLIGVRNGSQDSDIVLRETHPRRQPQGTSGSGSATGSHIATLSDIHDVPSDEVEEPMFELDL